MTNCAPPTSIPSPPIEAAVQGAPSALEAPPRPPSPPPVRNGATERARRTLILLALTPYYYCPLLLLLKTCFSCPSHCRCHSFSSAASPILSSVRPATRVSPFSWPWSPPHCLSPSSPPHTSGPAVYTPGTPSLVWFLGKGSSRCWLLLLLLMLLFLPRH